MSIVKTASGTSSERAANTVARSEDTQSTCQTTTLAEIKKKEKFKELLK